MLDAKTTLAVGVAVAAPMLLRSASDAGVPIPAYVTDAHHAAMAVLHQPIAGIASSNPTDMQAQHRYNELVRALPAPTHVERDAVLSAFVDAAKAGALYKPPLSVGSVATDLFGEELPYRVAADQGVLELYGDKSNVWELLVGGDLDSGDQTDLGRAVLSCLAARNPSWTFGAGEAAGPMTAAGRLAIEMDDQGYLITGKPPTFVAVASDAVLGLGKKLVGVAFDALGNLALPVLVVGGFFAYKLVTR